MEKSQPNKTNYLLVKRERPIDVYLAPTYDECILQLKRCVRESEASGKKTLIFCEDKLTLEAERAVVDGLEATFDTEITTFRRFIRKNSDCTFISNEGSVLLIAKLLRKNREKLRCFISGHAVRTAAERIYETISLFEASSLTPDDLLSTDCGNDLMLDNKLKDIALLYREYTEYLDSNRLADSESYMSLLPQAAEAYGLDGHTNVIFFANTSLRRRSQLGIRAILATAGDVKCIFCGSLDEGVHTNRALDRFLSICADSHDSFGYTLKEEIDCNIIPLKSVGCEESKRYLSAIFNPAAFSPSAAPCKTDKVRILEASNEDEELYAIACEIRRLVFTEGKKYRDMAVLVPSVGHYDMLLDRVFGEYKIPYFCDVKRDLSVHPFSRFLLACFAAVNDGFTLRSSLRIVNSVYFYGEERDRFTNYLIQYASYRGGALAPVKEEVLSLLSDEEKCAWNQMSERIRLIAATLRPMATVNEYERAVRALCATFDFATVTDEIAACYEKAGSHSESLYVSQGVGKLDGILNEIVRFSDGEKYQASEFKDLLQAGLAACKISVIPIRLDAVLVGDVGGTAKASAEYLFAAGLTSALPQIKEDVGLLSDRELSVLEKLKIHVEPTVCQENDMAKEVFAVNLAGFRSGLYLSYPTSYGEEESVAGDAIRYAERVFGRECKITYDSLLRDSRYLSVFCSERAPALRFATVHPEYWQSLSHVYGAVGKLDTRQVEYVESAKTLLLGKERISPSVLEDYFACPYRNFIEHGVKVKERQKSAVTAADPGNFIHAVLYRLAKDLNGESETEFAELARAVANSEIEKAPYCFLKDTASGSYSHSQLIEEAVRSALRVYNNLRTSRFKVSKKEAKIGGINAEYPAITITDSVRLSGIIDRVDEYDGTVRVIDYKTGRIDPSPLNYYTGKNLQLQLYINAAANGCKMAGVHYLRLSERFETESTAKKQSVLQGFINTDPAMLDAALIGAESIGAVAPDEALQGLSGEDFERLMRYALYEAKQGVDEISAGYIKPSPYEGECTYCPYQTMCGNESGESRKISKVTCEDIANVVLNYEEEQG